MCADFTKPVAQIVLYGLMIKPLLMHCSSVWSSYFEVYVNRDKASTAQVPDLSGIDWIWRVGLRVMNAECLQHILKWTHSNHIESIRM